jgi:hypothetical protein
MPPSRGDAVEGIELLRFARSLSAAPDLEQLKRRFLAGFGRLLGMPMYGCALVDPRTDSPTCVANGNVSATFVACYERRAKDVDPVLAQAYETGRTAYNMAIMSPDSTIACAEGPGHRNRSVCDCQRGSHHHPPKSTPSSASPGSGW